MRALTLVNQGNPDIFQRIELNTTQQTYLESIFNDDLTIKDNQYKEFVFFGGYRSGKSFAEMLAVYLICCKYSKIRAVFVRNTYNELKDTVIPQFRGLFEKFDEFVYQESSKEGSHIARFKNGSEIRFRSADEPTKLLSAEYDLIATCQTEAIPFEVIKILTGRWSGKRLPKKIWLNEGNTAGTWVKFAYKEKTKAQLDAENILFFEVSTHENLHNIDPDFIDDFKKRNPEIDYRRFILGEWVGAEEMVFTEFSEKNIIKPFSHINIFENCKKGIGGDHGWRNPATFVWGYKDYDGKIIIYDSWGKAQQSAQEIAKAGLKYGKQPCIYDYSCKEKDRYEISEWDRIQKAGLTLTECNKSDEAGIISYINSLLRQELLFITANNEELIWELNNWKYPPKKLGVEQNLKETPIDANNHFIDALKYLITWLEGLRSIHPKEIAEQKSFKTMVMSKPKKNLLNYG